MKRKVPPGGREHIPVADEGPILHLNLPLIEVRDRVLLDMVLADSQASRLIVTRLSDRVAVVAPGKFDALLARLRKLGHIPKVVEV